MLTRSWFDALKSRFLRTLNRHERRASGRRGLAARRLKVESLEDRWVLAFVVPSVNYDAGDNPQAIVSADFNGDGDLDLAVANYSGNSVSIFTGNGSGGFGAKTDFDTGANPRTLAVGDVSGDGKIDLITANAGGDVSILRGDGAGSFEPPDSIPLPDVYIPDWDYYLTQSPYSAATGDFNGDGLLDLAVTGFTSDYDSPHINVLLSDGSGGFLPTVTSLSNGLHTIAVGKFNADANDDLAIAHNDGVFVNVLLSDGSGHFSSSDFFYGDFHSISSVAAGDVNGDSLLDLVTANSYGNTVSVLLGTGTGSFGPPSTYAAGSQLRSVAMADFNGDTHIDLVTANSDNGTVSVLLGTGAGAGTGAFKPPVTAAAGSTPVGVAVGDFNGTGGPDVASANSGSDNVSVLLNNGIWPALNAPSVSVNNASVAEGQMGTTAMEFTVTLSAPSTQTVTVDYVTADSNAHADSDYVAALGTLTFSPGGPLTQKVNVLVNGDRELEYSEYFYLRLSDPVNAFLSRATGLGNIMDDEPLVSIDYIDREPVSVAEGHTGITYAEFTVRLAAPYDVPVNVNLSTAEGDTDYPGGYGYYDYYYPATSGSDFQPASNVMLSFAPNETEKTILIAVNGDRLAEPNEYFSVNLNSTDYGTIVAPHAVGVIIDDEPRANISGGGSVVEGNTGDPNKTVTFKITLSSPTTEIVEVHYTTGDNGSATAGSDYVAKSGTVIFNPGDPLSQDFYVEIIGDRLAENQEYFYVTLTGATGAVVNYDYSQGNIVDDEPRLSINNPSITEGNSGTKLLTFTVTLSAGYDQPVTVHYATQDGSATADSDYVAKSGTLTFNPGQPLTQIISVIINGDKLKEPHEYFDVVLSGASSNALIWDAYGLGTILSDDPGSGSSPGKGHVSRSQK